MYIPIKGHIEEGTFVPLPDTTKVWVNSERLDAIGCLDGAWAVCLASDASKLSKPTAYIVDTDQFDMERFIAVANYKARPDSK